MRKTSKNIVSFIDSGEGVRVSPLIRNIRLLSMIDIYLDWNSLPLLNGHLG